MIRNFCYHLYSNTDNTYYFLSFLKFYKVIIIIKNFKEDKLSLDQLNVNDSAVVSGINCDKALKNRFYSFGITKGTKLSIDKVTLAKSTMEVCINQTKIALRFSEAAKIEVEHV